MLDKNETLYEERLSSGRTQALFLALMLVFLMLFFWRLRSPTLGFLGYLGLGLSAFFLFYILNYRELLIRITPQGLLLKFGIFSWLTPFDTVASCKPDWVSLWRIGGAGIHFTWISGRYRIFFNFLEYPRLVLGLREPRGMVRDVVFSTDAPDEVMAIVRSRAGLGGTDG
jgi:hypothetical protein